MRIFKFVGIILALVLALYLWGVAYSRRKNAAAEAAAASKLGELRLELVKGEPMGKVELILERKKLQTMQRATGELFVIAQEGAGVWYCSHVFYGVMLHSLDGKLIEANMDTFAQDCL